MKVLIIIDSLVEAGAERSMTDIVLSFTNFTPVFVYVYKENTLREELEKAGIKVYGLSINSKYGFREAVKKLVPIYNQEKPDIIHSVLFRADFIARLMKFKYPQIPLIGSFVTNSYTPLRYQNQSFSMKIKLWLAHQFDRILSKKVDFYISNSETIKKSEGSALGVPQEKVEVIYRGRDLKKFKNVNGQEVQNLKKQLNIGSRKVILNVSRLIKRKGQLDLIRSLPGVLQVYPDTVLLIVGDGPYEERLQEEIAQLNLDKNVLLLGRRKDIPEVLLMADYFVYPSYAEGLPGALIEAMMAKKPIIASNISENLECVNEQSALIFETGNIEDLSRQLIYAFENPAFMEELATAARKQAAEKFSLIEIARKYERLYVKILNTKS